MAWLALWSIGAAPAMINYNLAGKALIHCLRVSGAKMLLVDEDSELVARIDDVRADIEGQLGMRISVLDAGAKKDIRAMKAERPADSFRDGVKGDWPMSIFYTRCVPRCSSCNQYSPNSAVRPVCQREFLSTWIEGFR